MTSSETTFNDEELSISDVTLIARLRDSVNGEHDMTPHGADVLQAADRIEELIAERNDWESHAIYNAEFVDLAVRYRNERDAARAAVKALESVIGEYDLFREAEYERGLAPLDDEIHEARAALAAVSETHKIKGESHD